MTREYKYALVGTWGYAPVARHWKSFSAWYWHQSTNRSYVPNVDNLIPSAWYRKAKAAGTEQSIWSMWFMDYCNQYQLYTVYYHHPLPFTLCAHWGERGEHFGKKKPQRDFPLVQFDVTPIERLYYPKLAWDGSGMRGATIDEQTKAIVTATKRVSASGKLPLITFVNDAFRNMTRHFFCNLRAVAPELFSSLIIVVGDAEAYHDLLLLRSDLSRFVVLPLTLPDVHNKLLMFGTRDYWNMMLVRTRLIAAITEQRVPLFMFECDATIRENFVPPFLRAAASSKAEFVGIQDNIKDKGDYPNGGFLLVTNRTTVGPIWKLLAARFQVEIDALPNDDSVRERSLLHEQKILKGMFNSNPPLATAYIMDRQQYRSGQTLDDPTQTKVIADARVVLLNYVIGNEAKRMRALKHNLWYYNETTDRCRE